MKLNPLSVAAALSRERDSASTLGPEWARPPKDGQLLEGLSRSYLYQLITAGVIKSISLTAPGSKKGIRLIHVPSVRAYLAKAAEMQLAAANCQEV